MAAERASVSLVIPGRNAAGTIRPCLEAVVPLLERGELTEILFVDDGSSDDTCEIAGSYPVRVLHGPRGGPGAARNCGWRAASGDLIWFIDSDCVAEPGALARLVAHLGDPEVAGAGGSYGNMRPDSLLACMIHEEIVARHSVMPVEVNFLGSFNVLYRRTALEEVGGFDTQWVNGPGRPGAEDADLAYRVVRAGHRLHFERESRVGHFHPTRLMRYLRSQRIHGCLRVNLHLRHPHTGTGDVYSSLVDHGQPPLAMLTIALIPAMLWPPLVWAAPAALFGLGLMQLPMTLRLIRRTGSVRFLAFIPLGMLRAFARGFGLTQGCLAAIADGGAARGAMRDVTSDAEPSKSQHTHGTPTAR